MVTGRAFYSLVWYSVTINHLTQVFWALWFLQWKCCSKSTPFIHLICSGVYLLSPRVCTSSRLWQMSSRLAWQLWYFHMQWQELFSRSINKVANSKDWLNQLQGKTTKDRSTVHWDTKLSPLFSIYTSVQILEGNLAMVCISRQLYKRICS